MKRKPAEHVETRKPHPRRDGRNDGLRELMNKWLGLALVAVGWVFVFAALVVPKTGDYAIVIVELGIAGGFAFGLGLGWIMRGDGGGGLDDD